MSQLEVPRAAARSADARRPKLEDVTIVIPTLGREILAESLQRIASGSAWPARVILVDQGQKQEVGRWAAKWSESGMDTVHVLSSQRGRASGINTGLAHVHTRFVAITDDDCFVREDWLESMVLRLRENPEAVITGRVEAVGEEAVINVVTSQKAAVYRRPRVKFDTLSGGNMGTAMATLDRVGYFDEDPRLRTAEDGEWAYRALRAGVAIVYAPEVAVAHVGWRGESDRYRQYKGYARSHGGFYGKYLRKGDWFIAARVAVHLVRSLNRAVRGVLTADRERAVHGWAYLVFLWPGMVKGMQSGRGEDQ